MDDARRSYRGDCLRRDWPVPYVFERVAVLPRCQCLRATFPAEGDPVRFPTRQADFVHNAGLRRCIKSRGLDPPAAAHSGVLCREAGPQRPLLRRSPGRASSLGSQCEERIEAVIAAVSRIQGDRAVVWEATEPLCEFGHWSRARVEVEKLDFKAPSPLEAPRVNRTRQTAPLRRQPYSRRCARLQHFQTKR